jgi:hypothetical protein
MVWDFRQALEQAACTKSAPYLSPPSSEIRKSCTRSSYLSEKSSPELTACIRTVRRYRKTGTVCNNAVQNCTSDISRWDRIRPQAPRRNLNSALVLPFPPSSVSADPNDPWLRAGRPAAASAPYLFFRVFPASRHHDSRGDRTCDPQTPPSVSRTGLLTTTFYTTGLDRVFSRYVSDRNTTNAQHASLPF